MADQIVTDPTLLSQLEGAQPTGAVTDPELLRQLEAKDMQAPEASWADSVKHLGGMAARVGVNAVSALPMMAEDAGVAVRNLGSGMTGGRYDQYEYPSDTLRQAEDQYFGKPQGITEKVEDALGPMAIGAGAARAPKTIATLLAASPESATTFPSNFLRPDQTKAQMLAASIKKAQDAGYVVPPSTTNPTTTNKLLESLAGKIAVQQGASIKNQGVTNMLASKALGLNPDAPITPEALQSVRSDAGKAYQAVRGVGSVNTDDAFADAIRSVNAKATGAERSFPGSAPSPILKDLDTLNVDKFDAGDAVDKISQLRDKADVAGRAGDKGLASQYKAAGTALEDQIDRHLTTSGADPDMVDNYRNARQTIAKSYTVEKALNPGNGDVSTQALARALKSGKPLSGELKDAAQFGSSFDKASQAPSKIGSAGVSHVGGLGSLVAASLGEHATGSGLGLLAAPLWGAARTGAKNYLLGPGQTRAIPKTVSALDDLGPTRAKASALAQAIAALDRNRVAQHEPAALPAY